MSKIEDILSKELLVDLAAACEDLAHARVSEQFGVLYVRDMPLVERISVDKQTIELIQDELGRRLEKLEQRTALPAETMSEDALAIAGFQVRGLNGGVIREWYKGIRGEGLGIEDTRLAVRFNERKDEKYAVWLILPDRMIRFYGVRCVEDLFLLKRLIGRPE